MFYIPGLIVVMLQGCYSIAQVVRYPVSSTYIALTAYSYRHADVFSISGNPASLVKLKNSSVGIHTERRFLLNELNNYTVAAALVMKTGNFGFCGGYSGFPGFNEKQAGITYSRKLAGNLDAGIHFNYYSIKIAGYGNASTVNFAIGYLLQVTDKIQLGMQAYNPFGGKFGNNLQEKVASKYSLGCGYEPSSNFFVSTEIEKEEDLPLCVKVGFHYQFHSQIMVRAGIVSESSIVFAGIGYIIKSFRIDVITSYHPLLGITPGILFLLNFKSE